MQATGTIGIFGGHRGLWRLRGHRDPRGLREPKQPEEVIRDDEGTIREQKGS